MRPVPVPARRLAAAVVATTAVVGAWSAGRAQEPSARPLDEHPQIQYATRPTSDRMATLSRALADGSRALTRDPKDGYLRPLLEALDIPIASQLLVFSKTGVQRAYTSPRNPRALYFDDSVVVGYVPGAPLLEIAAHDPRQGVVFYTIDQAAPAAAIVRRTSCLACHVSASTLEVPGLIARSNAVAEDGNVLPALGSNDVDHRTPHPDRWGGWFVTTDAVVPYTQRAHAGNITFTPTGVTSNQVFVDFMASSPDTRGYLADTSDIVSLLLFDHQAHAINLLTRLNWEARIGSPDVPAIAQQLAEYLLFVGEVPPSAPLIAPPGLAQRFAAKVPKDHRGRSLGQFDLDRRLLRYPCSYLIYSAAFDALPAPVRQDVYQRMRSVLDAKVAPDDRSAILEILSETKSDFASYTSEQR